MPWNSGKSRRIDARDPIARHDKKVPRLSARYINV
jgi:hypothetical protein